MPLSLKLHPAYPNPFNNQTRIRFELPTAERIKLAVYDLRGREVDILMNQNMQAGIHEVSVDAAGLASGLYFYRLETSDQNLTGKFLLVK